MEPERRQIIDVRVLAALAHPVRLALLHYLLAAGRATATDCSRIVDASPSACSYHLRHLERFGLVERDRPADGDREPDGRTRHWRAAATGFSFGGAPSADSPEMLATRQALAVTGFEENLRLVRHYVQHADTLPAEWQDAASFSMFSLLVSPAELVALAEAIEALVRPLRAVTRENAPADARRVRVTVDAFLRTDLS